MKTIEEYSLELEIEKNDELKLLQQRKLENFRKLELIVEKECGSLGKKIAQLIVFSILSFYALIMLSVSFRSLIMLIFLCALLIFFIIMIISAIRKIKKCVNLRKKYKNDFEKMEKIFKTQEIEIEEKYKKLLIQYKEQVKNKFEEMSVAFADSELGKEVIELLTAEFMEEIEKIERPNYLLHINYKYRFYIYYDHICSNPHNLDAVYYNNKEINKKGYYDFNEKRCRLLVDNVERTALARAITSQIQLNVMMKHSEKQTSKPIKINITYNENDYIEVIMEYIEENENYVPVRNW